MNYLDTTRAIYSIRNILNDLLTSLLEKEINTKINVSVGIFGAGIFSA